MRICFLSFELLYENFLLANFSPSQGESEAVKHSQNAPSGVIVTTNVVKKKAIEVDDGHQHDYAQGGSQNIEQKPMSSDNPHQRCGHGGLRQQSRCLCGRVSLPRIDVEWAQSRDDVMSGLGSHSRPNGRGRLRNIVIEKLEVSLAYCV